MTTILTTSQVTALIAQARAAATYTSVDATGELLPDWYIATNGEAVYAGADIATRGIGLYGQTPANLVLVGLLKPAALSLIIDPIMTFTVLNSPAVWTGSYSINSLADYLDSPILQEQVQTALYDGAYQGLVDYEVIVGDETAQFIAAFLQPAVRYGVDAVVAYLEGTADLALSSAIEVVGRQGIYAIDFVDTYGDELLLAPTAASSDNTVIRTQIDQAVSDTIDNPKIPTLEYANIAAIEADVMASVKAAELIANVANINITVLPSNPDDGTFRFSRGARQG
jgi:hypothetical protein